MTGTLLYHVVSPVHLRNAARIQRGLPDMDVVAVVDEQASSVGQADLDGAKTAVVDLRRESLASPWRHDVQAVAFSALQPRGPVLRLLHEAARRGLPTAALEESNQLALNDGRVNNYLLPVDALGVASPHEKDAMHGQGLALEVVRVTGWPFLPDSVPRDIAWQRATAWGLDPDAPIIALALTRLNDAGEPAPTRERLLKTAWQALPPGHQLAVKTHPIEPTAAVITDVRRHAPGAVVVPSETPVETLLAVSSALVSRGASQVSLEALAFGVPSLVVDTGRTTPFHADAPSSVVRDAADLRARLEDLTPLRPDGPAYSRLRARHAPYSPSEAHRRACAMLQDVIASKKPARDRRPVLALHMAFAGLTRDATEALEPAITDSSFDPLRRLIEGETTSGDLPKLMATHNLLDRAAVRSLLARQVHRAAVAPTDEQVEAMVEWPPMTNSPWYLRMAEAWSACLLRCQDSSAVEVFGRRLIELSHETPAYAGLAADLERCRLRGAPNLRFTAVRFGRRAGRVARRVLTRA